MSEKKKQVKIPSPISHASGCDISGLFCFFFLNASGITTMSGLLKMPTRQQPYLGFLKMPAGQQPYLGFKKKKCQQDNNHVWTLISVSKLRATYELLCQQDISHILTFVSAARVAAIPGLLQVPAGYQPYLNIYECRQGSSHTQNINLIWTFMSASNVVAILELL